MQGFHRALGAYRHEDRGLDRAVGGDESTAAGPGGGIVSEKLEHWFGQERGAFSYHVPGERPRTKN